MAAKRKPKSGRVVLNVPQPLLDAIKAPEFSWLGRDRHDVIIFLLRSAIIDRYQAMAQTKRLTR
jgi:hypothetical protein